MKNILVGITGASGSIYGLRLLQELDKRNITVHLIISQTAEQIFTYETNESVEKLKQYAAKTYENDDLFAGPASGSFPLDGMIIVPCSMKTLSAIANGYADALIVRSAICRLKEKKPLIVVPRETPMDYTGLKNMLTVSEAGGIVLPAAPGFYHQPQSLSDLVDFIVGKILDQLSISHELFKRWE
ncbi:MAG: UbiX family flavin prenyltransferase [Thermoplasmatota archaeon]